MPTAYKNIFATNDLIVHYRLKTDGVYEARFHRSGINVEVSSKDLTKLKQKFIEKLNNKPYEEPKPKKPEMGSRIAQAPIARKTWARTSSIILR